jgi:multicomponent Na+:H+ antiporter subunit F
MTDFLLAATLFVLAMVAVGLVCILRGPGDVDRMLSAQLFGTGGIAALLLLGVAADVPAVLDVALTLGVLAAFSAIAFVQAGSPPAPEGNKTEEQP